MYGNTQIKCNNNKKNIKTNKKRLGKQRGGNLGHDFRNQEWIPDSDHSHNLALWFYLKMPSEAENR